ncbi:MAG: NAD-dependent epimerase/dehydratase family protein [Bacteroidetes bacterium]|jgi:dTDP-glucose 4,6-dehydratase/UDP-glucuronate decarboxylase|nr:NAD-dependent epimerase/dehydratase family protein [Bacteroidota bacterium]
MADMDITNVKPKNTLSPVVEEDMQRIIDNLGGLVERFEDSKVLITGYKGFLGSNFTALFSVLNREVLRKKAQVLCMDSDIVELDDQISGHANGFTLIQGKGVDDLPAKSYDYVIHCAGIASPTFYRKFPLETINVNAIGYWDMLQKINHSQLKGFLYFSTSEIYGDPDPKQIPTREEYRGNVSCTGPRACYDESKRVGETISVAFAQEKGLPIKIVRPFNVYGPFMRLNDRRVIPDFVKFALEDQQIKLFSDGSPTRSFCYISDAIEGFTRALLIGENARPYNIGNDREEISMWGLAQLTSSVLGNVEISRKENPEKDYLTDNPQRRCPVIDRARSELQYEPKVSLDEGLQRAIRWYKSTYFSNQ